MKSAARGWSCLLLLALCGCGGARDDWPDVPAPAQPVTILETGSEADDPLRAPAEAILRDAFPDARRLRAGQLVMAGPGLRQSGTLLVVPILRGLDPAHWVALTNHVARGGLALYWGRLPGEWADAIGAWPGTGAYSFNAREIRGPHTGRSRSPEPLLLQGAPPGPRQWSAAASARWIPLAEAYDAGNALRGWPATLRVETETDGILQAWGWIGWDPDTAFKRTQQALLRHAATRLQRRQFLLRAGLDRFAIDPGDPFTLQVEMVTAVPATGPWRIAAEIQDAKGVTRRHAEVISSTGATVRHSAVLSLGVSARRAGAERDVLLRTSVADAGGAAPFDELEQPIRILAPAPAPGSEPAEALGVRGLGFTRGRRPLVLMGAAFDHRAAPPALNPLAPGGFDPLLAGRELDLLSEAGFNVLSVAYTDPEQTPQLRWLLEELAARQVRVLLELPALSPWSPDWETAAKLLSGLRLAPGNPLFALSPGPVTQPASPAERAGFEEAWRRWVAEQYGNSEHAAGQLGCPPDSISADNAWEATALPAAAQHAVRRFLDDLAARHFDACRAALAREGWTGLFTAGSGRALDPAAGIQQLDFVTLDGGAPGLADPARLAFLTLYARAVSGGKPVLWTGLSAPVSRPASPADLSAQANLLDRALAALLRAQAAGFIVGPLRGGRSDGDGADPGLVAPDGRWREAGLRVRARAQNWRGESLRPLPWRGREMDAAAFAGGVESAWTAWQDRFRAEFEAGLIEEVRPAGWGLMSADLPPAGLGGTPHANPAPFHYLNAQWLGTSGAPPGGHRQAKLREAVKWELLNTGLATWSASITGRVGSVWITASRAGARDTLLPVRETPPGARTQITWTPADPGRWILRPWLHPAGAFGQPLEIDVE